MAVKRSLKIGWLFFQRHIVLIGLGVFLGMAVFFLRQQIKTWSSRLFPPEAKIGLLGKYRREELPDQVIKLVSFGLTKLSPNGSAEPGAAQSWEVKDGGQQYQFHLNPLLRWQDQSALRAEQIDYQIEGAEISYPDDYTVAFRLNSPFAPLPALVSQPLFKKGFLGLGDYRIKRLLLNQGYVSLAKLSSVRKTNQVRKISFRFYPNEESLINAFKLGEVDCINGLSSIDQLKNWLQVEITPKKEVSQRYVALFFNTEKEPFSSKRFRQALAYAMKKPEEAIRAYTPISPSSWAYNANVKTYPFDPEHGRSILEEAAGETSLPEDFKIQIATTFALADWAEKIRQDWQNHLSLEVEIRILPVINPNQDFDVILGYGKIPADPDQYPYWHSSQAGNMTKFSNPRIDKLLEDGRASFSKEERKEIYQDFQRFLLEELPAIFLYYPTSYDVCRANASRLPK